MTKEQIDTLMQEAGIVVVGEAVYKLCQLVAAAEREACAALCFQMWNEWMDTRVGDQTLDNSNCPDAEDCAATIRARREQ